MPHAGEKLPPGAAGNGCDPADQIRPRTKEHEHLAVPLGTRSQAAVHSPAASRTRPQSRGRCGDRSNPLRPQTPCQRLACRIRVRRTGHDFKRKGWPCRRLLSQFHCPQRPADTGQVLALGYLLMAQKLRPRAVGRVTEVVRRTFALRMPAASGLRTVLPEKRIPGVGMAERDHVAGAYTRAAASSRTRRGPESSGCHFPLRTWAGERQPSTFRGRWNHRRMPNSL